MSGGGDTGILESLEGVAWLMTTLKGDATLTSLVSGVFLNVAPTGTPPPYAVIGVQSATDQNNAYGARMLADDLYAVRTIGPVTLLTSAIAPAARRIDLLLTRASGTTAAAVITSCVREQELAYADPDLVDGVQWINVGGVYRVLIYAK